MKKIVTGFFILLLLHTSAYARLHIKPDAPSTYTVQPGDTLIGIAKKFLYNPMEWGSLLRTNPNIKDPYHLYPGQVIHLNRIRGKPFVVLGRSSVIKLSPKMEIHAIDRSIPIFPIEWLVPFMNRSRVIDHEQIKWAPYVTGHGERHIATGIGDEIYAMHLFDNPEKEYSIFRQTQEYRDPRTRHLLGYEGLYVGDAEVINRGNPGSLFLTRSIQEIRTGDWLLPLDASKLAPIYDLHKPAVPVDGDIISVFDQFIMADQYRIVVIDRGLNQGIRRGDVLSIYHVGAIIDNPVAKDPINMPYQMGTTAYFLWDEDEVKLPNEWSGDMLIFRTFANVSYGIVLNAIRVIRVTDAVRDPVNI